MSTMSITRIYVNLEDEAEERYAIKRSYNCGKGLNVYKAYKKNNPEDYYVIKGYRTKEEFQRELQMLEILKNAKNIIQMVDSYSLQTIIVCEYALYDLITFLRHQDYMQRNQEKDDIVKDVASGLSELQKHNIVHTELSPKNIMYFKEKDGHTESWKLIDFDSACFTGSDDVKIIRDYSAPEVIRAYEKNEKIKAEFAMDMFSFGLVLYFLETGRHYWNGIDEKEKEEIILENCFLLDNVYDPAARLVIKQLLDENISNRMTLEEFKQTSYYTSESEQTDITDIINKDRFGMNETEFQSFCKKISQAFLDSYHNEMKEILKMMNNKIDHLSEITKEIPQCLAKLKNEKVPRMFIMIPDRKDWKKPMSWFSHPFRLLFVCEYKDQLHVPEHEGYKVIKVPQFIKKYGPWINLCLQTILRLLRLMPSTIFPHCVLDILSSVFNIADDADLIQKIQEVIDTVDIGVKKILDEDPDFNPLNSEAHQMVNATGLRELKRFLDKQDSADHFGGLVQCVDETQNILWLCEKHRDGYRPVEQVNPDPSRNYSPPKLSPQPSNPIDITGSLTPPPSPPPSPPSSPPSIWTSPIEPSWNYNKFDGIELTDCLDPFYALDYVYKILGEVVENAIASGSRDFRNDDIKKIASEVNMDTQRFKNLCLRWNNNAQKVQFINNLKGQVHLYIHFLMLITRYYAARRIKLFDIDYIISAGNSYNSHLKKLIAALESSQHDNIIQAELDSFGEPDLDDSIFDVKALSRWHYAASRSQIESPATAPPAVPVSPVTVEIKEVGKVGVLFDATNRLLDKCTTVSGKLLRYLDNESNFLCILKEIYLYNDHRLNESGFIIKFYGFSIYNCKFMLFYENANYGDLFEYFQENHDSSENLLKDWKEKIKLAWGISRGIKYLHDKMILHLDLRSANILLKYDEKEKTLTPQISNFFWSKYLHSQTSVHPKISISSKEEIWRRWHDPARLHNAEHLLPSLLRAKDEHLLPSSDVYSLGLLFWEIAWCKAENLPFKNVPIKRLYDHLKYNNHEELPEMPEEYRNWRRLINHMWRFKSEDRYRITDVESSMKKIYNKGTSSASSASSATISSTSS